MEYCNINPKVYFLNLQTIISHLLVECRQMFKRLEVIFFSKKISSFVFSILMKLNDIFIAMYRNELSLSSEFTFGQYRGIKVGLIYLFFPGYINWLLENTDKYINEIEDVKAMRVIKSEETHSSVMKTISGINIFELNDIKDSLSFDELKYSGTIECPLTVRALSENESKMKVKKRRSFYYPEDNIPFWITYYKCKSVKVQLKFIDLKETSKQKQYLIFSFDNSNNIVSNLKTTKDCKFATLHYNDWNIATSELEYKINNQIDVVADLSSQRPNLLNE